MGLNITMHLIIIGENTEGVKEAYNVANLLPDDRTLGYGLRHCFNYWDTPHPDKVMGAILIDDGHGQEDDVEYFKVSQDEVTLLRREFEDLGGADFWGIVTLDDYKELSKHYYPDGEVAFIGIIEEKLKNFDHLNNRRVFVLVEGDQA